jgi:N-hydroxyarylamine O-acetyltransferase
MDLDRYLKRIGFEGDRTPNYVTLAALQRAHIDAVPFDGRDCSRLIPLTVDPDALFEKIVEQERGGFCFELNGLFSIALRELGFDVTLLAARPFWGSEIAPERAHLTLLVHIAEERWLADVGYGHWTPYEPLRLDDRQAQVRDGRPYLVRRKELDWSVTYQLSDRGAGPEGFRFRTDPHELADFAEQCLAYSTDPASPFARSGVYSERKDGEWNTVTRTRWIRSRHGVDEQGQVTTEEQYRKLLKERFGLEP